MYKKRPRRGEGEEFVGPKKNKVLEGTNSKRRSVRIPNIARPIQKELSQTLNVFCRDQKNKVREELARFLNCHWHSRIKKKTKHFLTNGLFLRY